MQLCTWNMMRIENVLLDIIFMYFQYRVAPRRGPSGRFFMDALGALGSLSTLKQLIPSLSFAGTYGHLHKATISVPPWKFGIATVSTISNWYTWISNGGCDGCPVVTALVSPHNISMQPSMSSSSVNPVVFDTQTITLNNGVQFTALLFNY